MLCNDMRLAASTKHTERPPSLLMCRNKMINYAQRSRNLSETNTETINELYYLHTRTLIFVYLVKLNSYIIRHHTTCYHDSGAIKETFYLKFAYSQRRRYGMASGECSVYVLRISLCAIV